IHLFFFYLSLAGFAVGLVDRKKVINGKRIRPGDVILGIASSGLHSNGYSLVRKILTKTQIKKEAKLLLKPTFIYTKSFFGLARSVTIKGAANITGGGFYDNVPRMLPAGVKAVIRRDSWRVPKVFAFLLSQAEIKEEEMYRTFNMGIGMTLALSAADAEKAIKILKKKFNLGSWVIGKIVKGKRSAEII
ncbi:phosphoribosylformylglycinamidine cyclo-ligase, partial [Candidatus Omnitrophota bacterium]